MVRKKASVNAEGNAAAQSTRRKRSPWTDKWTEVFLELCVEQKRLGYRQGGCLNSEGWIRVVQKFNDHPLTNTDKPYDIDQLKTRWDTLRKNWRKWKQLSLSTGVHVDEQGQIRASDEWWM